MSTPTPKAILDAIGEIHRFETSSGKIEDFKAVVVELRSLLAKAIGQIVGLAIGPDTTSANKENFQKLVGWLEQAASTCDTVAMLAGLPGPDSKMLATWLVAAGKLTTIEAFFNAVGSRWPPQSPGG